MEGIPGAEDMLGIVGIPEAPGAAGDCRPIPGGSAGIFGIGGIAGAPDGNGIGWGAGGATLTSDVVAGCGPTPGGKPPGGIGPAPNGAGIPGMPGAPTVAISVDGFKCTKLRLFGKSSVSAPELMSRMSTG